METSKFLDPQLNEFFSFEINVNMKYVAEPELDFGFGGGNTPGGDDAIKMLFFFTSSEKYGPFYALLLHSLEKSI